MGWSGLGWVGWAEVGRGKARQQLAWLRGLVHAIDAGVFCHQSLLMASKGGHEGIVRLLLAANADTEVAGRAYGTTSLVAASQHGHNQIVKILLQVWW